MLAKKLFPYLFAAGAVGLIGVVRATFFQSLMGDGSPFGLFTLAVICSAWIGGLAPGLLATGLSVLTGVVFFIDPETLGRQHVVLAVIFSLSATLISIVCESLRRSRQPAEEARQGRGRAKAPGRRAKARRGGPRQAGRKPTPSPRK